MFCCVPDDHSRVMLRDLPPGCNNDYINASFIDVSHYLCGGTRLYNLPYTQYTIYTIYHIHNIPYTQYTHNIHNIQYTLNIHNIP